MLNCQTVTAVSKRGSVSGSPTQAQLLSTDISTTLQSPQANQPPKIFKFEPKTELKLPQLNT